MKNTIESESIKNSPLAANDPGLAKKILKLWEDAKDLHAEEGARRLELICIHYDTLSPEKTYSWVDPVGFQHEVEEAISLRWYVRYGHIVRNCLSVVPLIITWFALYTATAAYPLDHNKRDAGKSFLQLWQEGFSGVAAPFPFISFFRIPVITFSEVATFDVFFLLMYFILIWYTSGMESRAYAISTKFVRQLQEATKELMVARKEILIISKDQTSNENLAAALKLALAESAKASNRLVTNTKEAIEELVQASERTLKALAKASEETIRTVVQTSQEAVNKTVMQSEASIKEFVGLSKQSIVDANEKVNTLYSVHIMPMMSRFNTDLATLNEALTGYQERLDTLTDACQLIANAPAAIMSNAEAFRETGEVVSRNIAELNHTQKTVLEQIQVISVGITSVAGDMSQTATAMSGATEEVKKVAVMLQKSIGTLDEKVEATMKATLEGVESTTNAALEGIKSTNEELLKGMGGVITTATERVGGAISALRTVGPKLDNAATTFDQAVTKFSELKVTQNTRNGNGNRNPFKDGLLNKIIARYWQNEKKES
jgi:ABC-type transporter Mla subunit MlaD